MGADEETGGIRRSRLPIFDGGTDFDKWQKSIELALRAAKCWKVVTGEWLAPIYDTSVLKGEADNFASDYEKWEEAEYKAMELIYNCLSRSCQPNLGDDMGSRDLWLLLQETYGRRTRADVAQLARKLIDRKKKPDESMHLFLTEASNLWAQVRAARSNWINDEFFIVMVCTSLPIEYHPTVIAIMNDEKSTVQAMLSALRSAESTLQEQRKVASSTTTVMKATTSTDSRAPTCKHCERVGHVSSDCWSLAENKDKRPSEIRKKAAKAERAKEGNDSKEDKKKKPEEQEQAKLANSVFDALSLNTPERALVAVIGDASAYRTTTNTNVIDLIVDSGASRHMFADDRMFTSKNDTATTIRTAENGRNLTTTATGSAVINVDGINHRLDNALVVPGLDANLLSLSKIQQEGGSFWSEGSNVMVVKVKNQVFRAKVAEDNLYHLHGTLTPASTIKETALVGSDTNWSHWHDVLGHLNKEAQQLTLQHYGIEVAPDEDTCDACIQGKMTSLPFNPRDEESVAKRPMYRIHTDLCGPFSVSSFQGAKYFLTFLDDYSNYAWVIPMPNKQNVPQAFEFWLMTFEKATGHSVAILRSDRGGEYLNSTMHNILQKRGIRHELTAGYTPQQNGKAERLNRTLLDIVRTWMAANKFDKRLWAELIIAAAYIRNLVWSKPASGIAYQKLWGRLPEVKSLQPVGPCWVHVQDGDKLDPRAKAGWVVGYSDSRTFRVWDGEKVINSRHVQVRRDSRRTVPNQDGDSDAQSSSTQRNDVIEVSTDPIEPVVISGQAGPAPIEGSQSPSSMIGTPVSGVQPISSTPPLGSGLQGAAPSDFDLETLDEGRPDRPLTQVQRYGIDTATRAKALDSNTEAESFLIIDNVDRHAEVIHVTLDKAFVALTKDHQEPNTYEQAVSGPDSTKWKEAIQSELNSLRRHGTWDVVQNLPSDRRPITNKWVFKVKRDEHGKVAKYKARLVVRGFSQIKGLDYQETFAPVSRLASFRMFVAMAAERKFVLKHWDIETAFLNGNLQEDVWMTIPQGFESKGGTVVKLNKSLYGLKQAPRAWHQKLKSTLSKIGFTECVADECMFERQVQGQPYVALLIYVDDIIVATASEATANHLLGTFQKYFTTKDLGPLTWYLGIKVEYDPHKGHAKLSQSSYIHAIIERFNLKDAKPVATPIAQTVETSSLQTIDSSEISKDTPYAQAVGCLLYIALGTRPDIMFAVAIASRHCANPTTVDWRHVQRIIRYLKGTPTLGPNYESGKATLVGYSDADFAAHADRHSVSGSIFFYAGGPILWASKRQAKIAISTQEAELNATFTSAKDGIWLRKFLRTGLYYKPSDKPVATVLYTDSTSALAYIAKTSPHARTKHYDIEVKWLQEIPTTSLVFQYVATEQQRADWLTKGLTVAQFQRARIMANVH